MIAFALRSPSQRTKSLILEIFGAVCLLPGGHTPVLDGLEALCEVSGSRHRFDIVMESLWNSCQPNSLDNELQVASMSFINAVTCGGPGDDFAFRLHMRWEFIDLGLMEMIDKIGLLDNELLQTQIDVWLSGIESDEAILFSRLGVKEINSAASRQLGIALSESITDTSCHKSYLSLLKHVALLPANTFERLKYMTVIDKAVQQIVLQRNGKDPDPSSALANIDISGLFQQSNVEESKGDAKAKLISAEKRITELEKILAEKTRDDYGRMQLNSVPDMSVGERIGLGILNNFMNQLNQICRL